MLASVLVEPPAPALAAATPQLCEPSLEPAAKAESSQPSLPSPEPAAGGGQASRVEVTPGSGHDALASPGSGSSESWNSRDPGTPRGLSNKVLKPYVPQREALERYQERVRKQARFLTSLGQPLAEGVLEVLLAMSEYELRLYEEARGDPLEQKNF